MIDDLPLVSSRGPVEGGGVGDRVGVDEEDVPADVGGEDVEELEP